MNRFRRALVALYFVLGVAGISTAAASVSQDGAAFPKQLEAADTELHLAGTGITKYRVIFTVCAVGFYVPEATDAKASLDADTPRRLEIEYFYEIPAEDIIRASQSVLDNQLSQSERDALSRKLDRWHQAYRGVEDGDRYSMTYQPGTGTTLRLNGESLVTVPGADFARAYFGIWLKAKQPLSQRLRRNLIAGLD